MTKPRTRDQIDSLIEAAAVGDKRVFRIDLDGAPVWVKRGTKDFRNVLQRLLGWGASLPLRHMTPARQRVYSEVRRLRALRRAGFNVPDILCVGSDYLALSDMGVTLDAVLRKDTASDEARRLVRQAAEMVAELHLAGQWHGAARVRNFTVRNRAMGMIDFEDPVAGLPHIYNRLMDLFMLTLSLARREPTGRLAREALTVYGAKRSLAEFRTVAFLMLPTYLVLRPFHTFLGQDGKQIVACLKAVYVDTYHSAFATSSR
ncbi:lipopolysaccharide kinase InaA family protein [Ancylobacter terrae]|uniref:lipopolysaccharide kinase InaA family protein n=1 Tax=Ancylobacter sp. sgz301288 TaxID=3342077 RepID=UPI00385BAB75